MHIRNRPGGNELPFAKINPYTKEMAGSMIADYIANANAQAQQNGPQLGVSRAYVVLEDIPKFSTFTQQVYLGMLRNELSWINVEVLPTVLVETITISTETLIMERSLPTRVPQFGVATMGRSYHLKNSSKTEIYAGAITVEGEAYDSEAADEVLLRQMMQIVGGHMMLLSLMAYARLLECNELQFKILSNGRNLHATKARMERAIDMYAMPYKYKRGMFKYVQEFIHLMEAGLGQKRPTHCIVQPGRMRVITTGSDDYGSYDKGGDPAVERSTGDGSVRTICGVQIREGPAEYSESTGMPILLTYASYVADHHLLRAYPDSKFDHNDLPYIGIYDISQDKVVDIMFMEALEASGRFKKVPLPAAVVEYNPDESTHLWQVVVSPDEAVLPLDEFTEIARGNRDPFFNLNVRGEPAPRRHWTKQRFYNADCKLVQFSEDAKTKEFYDGAQAKMIRWAATHGVRPGGGDFTDAEKAEVAGNRYGKTPLTVVEFDRQLKVFLAEEKIKGDEAMMLAMRETFGQTLKEWSELVCFLLARPMRGTAMQSIVFACGGPDLGVTAYKPTQFEHGVDAVNNTHAFRNQMRAVCHITNSFLAAVGENATYAGVLNGGNARLINFKEAQKLASAETQFEISSERDPSVYSICIPLHPIPREPHDPEIPMYRDETRICLTGVLVTAPEDTPDIPGYQWCNKVFGWSELNVGQMGEFSERPISMMSCRGWSNYPTDGGRKEITGTGHHGMYEGPGVRGVRMQGLQVYDRLM